MGMTVVEKILARASGRDAVRAGDVVEPRVDLAMSHENAALVAQLRQGLRPWREYRLGGTPVLQVFRLDR